MNDILAPILGVALLIGGYIADKWHELHEWAEKPLSNGVFFTWMLILLSRSGTSSVVLRKLKDLQDTVNLILNSLPPRGRW